MKTDVECGTTFFTAKKKSHMAENNFSYLGKILPIFCASSDFQLWKCLKSQTYSNRLISLPSCSKKLFMNISQELLL